MIDDEIEEYPEEIQEILLRLLYEDMEKHL